MVSNFVEVFLAREGHKNPVGINFLEKVQMPHLSSIYGAMLAGVGYVLMGAGIPLHIPGVLDALALHQPAEYKLAVTGAVPGQDTQMHLDPAEFAEGPIPLLHRPRFLAIVSSNTLATTMLRRASGRVDGLVIESPTAGGHNAPPRGKLQLNAAGEPVYGERDRVDIQDLRGAGRSLLAGGRIWKRREGARGARTGRRRRAGGNGLCVQPRIRLRPDLKKRLLAQAMTGTGEVFTDPLASPTGFPFKVAQLQGSLLRCGGCSGAQAGLRSGLPEGAIRRDRAAALAYRCAAEPVDVYVSKGGKIEDTVGRKCLCNALMANIGHQQTRKDDAVEPPLVTVGDDLNTVAQFLAPGRESYSAADVIDSLLSLTGDAAADSSPAYSEEPVLASA